MIAAESLLTAASTIAIPSQIPAVQAAGCQAPSHLPLSLSQSPDGQVRAGQGTGHVRPPPSFLNLAPAPRVGHCLPGVLGRTYILYPPAPAAASCHTPLAMCERVHLIISCIYIALVSNSYPKFHY
jgi:hypothetical protein